MNQHISFFERRWWRLAETSSLTARVWWVLAASMLVWMLSICVPCSLTSRARSWNISATSCTAVIGREENVAQRSATSMHIHMRMCMRVDLLSTCVRVFMPDPVH